MGNEAVNTLPRGEKQGTASSSAPVLKRVSCIYVPATEPDKTMAWFKQHFGLNHNGTPWLTLGNGADIMFVKASKGALMTFRTDAWAGPGFQMNMLSFEVDDIDRVHRALSEEGVRVEEVRDLEGCGVEFYFYDPDGNKFCVWEMQTVVRRKPEKHEDWKKHFVFGNCYLEGDVDKFLTVAAEGSLGASRRIKIAEYARLAESGDESLKQLLREFDAFNGQYPASTLRLVP